MTRMARSRVLALHAPAPSRARVWWKRRITMLMTVLVVAMPVFAVVTEALSPDGVGWLLYSLHDSIWLPFWSFVWVRAGIWSLIWWLPVSALAGLTLVEFLGLGQPLRRLQTAVLRGLLRSPVSPLVLAAQQRLGWQHNREGLLVSVLESELLVAEAALRAAAEAGGTADTARVSRLMTQLAYLRAADPARQVRCAECLMLIGLFAEPDHVFALRTKLDRIWPEADGARIKALLWHDTANPVPLFDILRKPDSVAFDLALANLAFARAESLVRSDLVRVWFEEWARLRHDPRLSNRALPEAERMIDFEFWAARAEAGIAAREVTGDRKGWLGALLPGVAMRRPMGERAAICPDGETP